MKMPKLWFFLLPLLFISGRLGADKEPVAVEIRIKTILVDPSSQVPVVLLETIAEKKLIPIWIDVPEAKAIALELEQVAVPRPLTHDLMRNILEKLGAKLQRVTITEIRNNTYFAVLALEFNGQLLQIDSRPSDAIALATRMKAPIFATQSILEQARTPPATADNAEQPLKSLGLQGQDLTEELSLVMDLPSKQGVLVADVTLGGPAMAASVERGDIITKANDREIRSVRDLAAMIQTAKSPAQMKIEVLKKGKASIVIIDLP
jgi:hypothetical protein